MKRSFKKRGRKKINKIRNYSHRAGKGTTIKKYGSSRGGVRL